MKYLRFHTDNGGIVRLSYNLDNIIDDVRRETQLAGRNMVTEETGVPDMNKMAGPDDDVFVDNIIKEVVGQTERHLPKNVKSDEFHLVKLYGRELTISLSHAGRATKEIISLTHEIVHNIILNLALASWYESALIPKQGEPHMVKAGDLMNGLVSHLIKAYITPKANAGRYANVTFSGVTRRLKNKYYGSYQTVAIVEETFGDVPQDGSIVFIEAEQERGVYVRTGGTWQKLQTVIEGLIGADIINPEDNPDMPKADQGDVFTFSSMGTIGGHKDIVYPGDALICIATNNDDVHEGSYKNNLQKFIVIG